MESLDLSIVIVSFNTRELIRCCIQSILVETSEIMYEIIVVDNHSSDGSVSMIRECFPAVRVIENTDNKGFGPANNQGVKVSSGRYVLFLNSDTIVLNHALDRTLRFMDRCTEASIVGIRQLNTDHSLQPSLRGFPSLWNVLSEATFLYKVFPKTHLFGRYYYSDFDYESTKHVEVVMGSFMMVRREVLTDIIGFDEAFFFYSEETDFCYRALQLGHQSYYFPGAEIIHHGGGSSGNWEWKFRQLHKAQYQFIDKHYRGLNNIMIRSIKRIAILIRVPVYLSAWIILRDKSYFLKAKIHLVLTFENYRQ